MPKSSISILNKMMIKIENSHNFFDLIFDVIRKRSGTKYKLLSDPKKETINGVVPLFL